MLGREVQNPSREIERAKPAFVIRLDVFQASPGMDDVHARKVDCEHIAAARWLVTLSTDSEPGKMAKEQRADTAMANHQYVTIDRVFYDLACFFDDALLGVDGAFPPSDAFVGGREESIGNRFKLVGFQEASCASIILMSPRAQI